MKFEGCDERTRGHHQHPSQATSSIAFEGRMLHASSWGRNSVRYDSRTHSGLRKSHLSQWADTIVRCQLSRKKLHKNRLFLANISKKLKKIRFHRNARSLAKKTKIINRIEKKPKKNDEIMFRLHVFVQLEFA